MSKQVSPTPEELIKNQKMIWIAMMSSVTVIFYVANYGTRNTTENIDPNFKYILLAAAGGVAVLSFIVRGMAKAKVNDVTKGMNYRVANGFILSLMSWALSEAVGIFGFVIMNATGDKTIGNGLIAIALVLIGLYRPIVPSNNNLRRSYTTENRE